MARPTDQQFAIHVAAYPGARIVNFPTPGGPPAPVQKHDIIPNVVGWHVAVKDHFLPVQGYPVGYSDDNVHFSMGPSSTGAGVPGSQLSDGRIQNSDGTFGGGGNSAAGLGSGGSGQRGF